MKGHDTLDVSVFGLGYVGAVTAACLARDGHDVIGVDIDPSKVRMIRAGRPPIVETGLEELLMNAVQSGKLRATTDAAEAVELSSVSVISVGTPSQASGGTDLSFVKRVCEEIGRAIRAKTKPHVVVLRSTVPPGTLATCHDIFRSTESDALIHLAFNPEFLREGNAIEDYDNPPYTIIGTTDAGAERAVRAMYATVDAPIHVVDPGTAELVKFVANAWHAAKITFANEVGRLAKGFGLDGSRVMDLIVKDTKLNVSSAYMKPGGAYGGSCLPKDVNALIACAREMAIPVPVLEAIPMSNQHHIDLSVAEILALGRCHLAIFGLAFKPGTDDLRESPSVPLVKQLIGEGFGVKIYDPHVNRAALMGTNLHYIRSHVPHFESLMAPTAEAAVEGAEAIVLTQPDADLRRIAKTLARGRSIVDLPKVLASGIVLPRHGLT